MQQPIIYQFASCVHSSITLLLFSHHRVVQMCSACTELFYLWFILTLGTGTNFNWLVGYCVCRLLVLSHSLFTAIHSLRSSPSGSMTACLRFPLPSVASACFSSSYWWEPSGMFFFGLKVLDERLPLERNQSGSKKYCLHGGHVAQAISVCPLSPAGLTSGLQMLTM